MTKLRFFAASALTLFALGCACATEPWHVSFPEISYDEANIYFANERWTAVFKVSIGAMFTVPRDSVPFPPARPPEGECHAGLGHYALRYSVLAVREPGKRDTAYSLPTPNAAALEALTAVGGIAPVDPNEVYETMGPMCGYAGRVWLGLALTDPLTTADVGGIGWFDPAMQRFGRVYSILLAGLRPRWLYAANDTVMCLYTAEHAGTPSVSRMAGYAVNSGDLFEIFPSNVGLPGEKFLGCVNKGDTVLVATDEAVCLWWPGYSSVVWATDYYASRDPVWTYLKTFPGGDPDAGDTVRFQILPNNRPAMVKARIGGWLQLAPPEGIIGYVNPAAWDANRVLWTQNTWGCDGSPCFVRVKVPMQGKMVPSDFTNTPLTFLDVERSGVKVGFVAAWVREEHMTPVLQVR